MTRLFLTLAIAVGLAIGSMAIMSSDVLACGGKDKGASTEGPSPDTSTEGTQS